MNIIKNISKNIIKNIEKNNKDISTIRAWKRQGIKYDKSNDLCNIFINTNNCVLCSIQFDNTQRNKKCLDHQHGKSGCPRFICCSSCNTKLTKIDNQKNDLLLDIHRYLLSNF